MVNVKDILEKLKSSPYEEIEVIAPHCGVLNLSVRECGTKVSGPSGTWKEKSGTLLATITRENNQKPITAPQNGMIEELRVENDGMFIQAGTPLLKIKQYLTKEKVIDIILRHALYLFPAPERGIYYFTPEVDKNVKAKGSKAVHVRDRMELFIISRMKRETQLAYTGPEGLIYSVYFRHNRNVDADDPLIGVCPESGLVQIQEVVARVQSEWEEKEM